MTNQTRKQYWNKDYFEYWKKRVAEANQTSGGQSAIIKGDAKVPSDQIYKNLIAELNISGGKILDVGCGWGLMFPIFAQYKAAIYGIDISQKMVEEARKQKEEIKEVIEVKESEAENIPYENETFDYLTCFGVFDACFQEQTLKEMLRVLKPKGKLLITGKNANYFPEDEQAKAAEIGARRKGHPNFFTDTAELKTQLKNKGHEIITEHYCLYRGDSSIPKYHHKMPEKFYEYCLIIEKGSNDYNFNKFSSAYSNVK